LENVSAGALFAGREPTLTAAREAALRQLEFTGLAALADSPASTLTLAQRKRLELAKSLAMRPRLLMLDEVNAGLNPSEIDDALDIIRRISASGVTIIVVEHLMKVVLSISQRIVVLHHGQLIAEGEPKAVLSSPAVVEAYLGKRYAGRIAGGGA
jgi:branched-chain amino acid transport system ATP-binding protein